MRLGAGLTTLIYFLIALYGGSVFAHGGVSIQGNKCILSIGPYSMNFTGYQPATNGYEYCDDIPQSGKTIIVLDFNDPSLRAMDLEFRIIKSSDADGIIQSMDDKTEIENLESITVKYLAYKKYTTGTLNIEYEFSKGDYIGIVNVKNNSEKYTSIFPFTVEPIFYKLWHLLIIMLVFTVGFSLFITPRIKKSSN